MADPHIKSTLERHIAETEARLAEYGRMIETYQTGLVHLRGALAFLLRDDHHKPSSPIMSLANVFKRGEAFAICKLALEKYPSGMDTRELATICLRSKDLNPEDRILRRSMMQTLAQMMQVRRETGHVETVEKRGLVCVWRLCETKVAVKQN